MVNQMDKVILAFSGGLDTTVCVKLLEENYNLEVVTACVDVGQPKEEIEKAEEAAKNLGVKQHYTIDAKDEFANEYIAKGIKANAVYEGYPLSTALARPLIAMKIIEIGEKENAKAIAHGCTGKGNDQFRFEAVIRSMSNFDIIAPIRDLNLTRTEEQEYAKKHDIPLSPDKIYSIDENVWGRSIEGDILEDPANEPPEESYAWTASVEDSKNHTTKVAIEFEEGIPIAIDGQIMPLFELVEEANKIAGENGIGRIDTIENRVIGLKSREIYEVPGALLLIRAHQALEELVLTKDELLFAEYMSTKYSDLVYTALWQEPLRDDMDQAIDNMQMRVTGKVVLKLFKGSMTPVSRESDYSLHDIEQISFEDKENDQKEVEGMIKHHGLQASIYQKLSR
ncbi:Argininosuccinate synthase [Candidatus Methanobinarius endosymbioticus]|uniref:Argininosuccinate synthase n=1 Tax=Candidatus Methanobinarius endosymbioticus TaxID=2006182 RepID=A0A366M891_9EURY|nr:Argininosuccinate synthase [Candidatus Methanobinarius endosymbioticus]